MKAFNAALINVIADVPGLYISDISIPRSPDLLREHNITHVLSLTNQKDKPTIAKELGIQHEHIEIEDNPLEDLVMSLEGACAWIDNALTTTSQQEPRALVHCIQGISRSGAIIIAFLMRSQSLDYESAFGRALKSRSIIGPNSGFADQLRLWKEMNFSIYETSGHDTRKLNSQYTEWRANRGLLLSKGEEAKQEVMRKSMADMAARFGRRRLELKEQE